MVLICKSSSKQYAAGKAADKMAHGSAVLSECNRCNFLGESLAVWGILRTFAANTTTDR